MRTWRRWSPVAAAMCRGGTALAVLELPQPARRLRGDQPPAAVQRVAASQKFCRLRLMPRWTASGLPVPAPRQPGRSCRQRLPAGDGPDARLGIRHVGDGCSGAILLRSRRSGAASPAADRCRTNLKPPCETALDPAYISAFSGLAGAAIGGFASFSTSWATQRAQIRHSHSEAERARLEALYSEFITESARLVADALSHQKDDVADMVGLYALVGSDAAVRPVTTAGGQRGGSSGAPWTNRLLAGASASAERGRSLLRGCGSQVIVDRRRMIYRAPVRQLRGRRPHCSIPRCRPRRPSCRTLPSSLSRRIQCGIDGTCQRL